MPRKRNTAATPVPFGMSTKQMKRKKPINEQYLKNIEPLTENQEKFFHDYGMEQNIFAYGAAGTGKTFCALYKGLYDCLKATPSYDQVYLVRSLVATREIGFLPGDHEDKSSLYQIPYKNMVKYMFEAANDNDFEMLYGQLKAQESIKFWSTSFLRGVTLDNSVIIIDEMQNLNFHELDSIITRVGENTRIVFCGDAMQSDLQRDKEKNGIHDFMRILEKMPDDFEMVEMGIDDICRSGLVRNYLIAKNATL